REIARLLGGELGLVSQPSVGSTFTLYIPQTFVPQKVVRRATLSRPRAPSVPVEPIEAAPVVSAKDVDDTFALTSEFADDRNSIQDDDLVVLIVDNDVDFAEFVLETSHKVGFKGIMTASGAAAIALASQYQPHAILLDISLPDINGWQVLDRLKHDLALQHIPIYFVSTADQLESGLKHGITDILPKPIQTAEVLEAFLKRVHTQVKRQDRRIIALQSAAEQRKETIELLSAPGVTIDVRESGADVLEAVEQEP